jgi:hypothetical protein
MQRNENVRISFDSPEEKDKGFFELIQTSGSGFTGVGINEFIVTSEQIDLLKSKDIKFTTIIKES